MNTTLLGYESISFTMLTAIAGLIRLALILAHVALADPVAIVWAWSIVFYALIALVLASAWLWREKGGRA